jgi:hypothetical protein
MRGKSRKPYFIRGESKRNFFQRGYPEIPYFAGGKYHFTQLLTMNDIKGDLYFDPHLPHDIL